MRRKRGRNELAVFIQRCTALAERYGAQTLHLELSNGGWFNGVRLQVKEKIITAPFRRTPPNPSIRYDALENGTYHALEALTFLRDVEEGLEEALREIAIEELWLKQGERRRG